MKKWVRGLCTLAVVMLVMLAFELKFSATISYASQEGVEKDGLERVIESAEKILPGSYSEDSYAVLKSAIEEAQSVLEDTDATQAEVDEAMMQVSDAIAGLREKFPVILIVVLVVAVAFVIGSGIVFVVVRVRESHQSEYESNIIEQNTWQTQMTSVESNRVRRIVPQTEQSQPVEILVSEEEKQEEERTQEPEYICEATTILSQELGQTAVLYQPQPKYEPKAYLIRVRTGERIDITKPEFVLGKDYTVTDYCVEGNSAISRIHAVFIDKNNEFELGDKNATNGTYVNGLKVMEQWNVAILDGDIVKLADEEFEFHYIL